jgi:hypothetical protein
VVEQWRLLIAANLRKELEDVDNMAIIDILHSVCRIIFLPLRTAPTPADINIAI